LDQEYYINDLVPTFGPEVSIALAGFVPIDISMRVRFVHVDPTKPQDKLVDELHIVIKSSRETTSDFCDYSSIALASDQADDVAVVYNIDHRAERDALYISTMFDGFDALSSDCKAPLSLVLDTQINGIWSTLYSQRLEEWPAEDMLEHYNFYFFKIDVGTKRHMYLSVRLSSDDYLNYILSMYHLPYNTAEVQAPFRVAVVNDKGETIKSDEFQLKIKPIIEIVNECAHAVPYYRSQGDSKSIAFESQSSGRLQSMDAHWKRTLETGVDSPTGLLHSCRPKFFMQIWDPRSLTWVSSDEMKELIETEIAGEFQLTSEVNFNETSSELNTTWTDTDFYGVIQSYFAAPVARRLHATAASSTNRRHLQASDSTWIEFRIFSFVPGSEYFGIDAIDSNPDTLPQAHISLEFIDGNKVQQCRNNALSFSPLSSYSSVQRQEVVNYDVPSSYYLDSADPFLIEGKQIVASNPDCAL
jgi:hypothetical protein